MRIINLTPHRINIRCVYGTDVPVEPSGDVARVAVRQVPAWAMAIETDDASSLLVASVYQQSVGQVEGLPEPQDGVVCLVSLAVRQAVPHRTDVVSPGTLIRDAQGQPVACDGLTGNGGDR